MLNATDHHPIWDAGWDTFEYAVDLKAGETVLRPAGKVIRLAKVRITPESLTVYNLIIEGIHTYYAGAHTHPRPQQLRHGITWWVPPR